MVTRRQGAAVSRAAGVSLVVCPLSVLSCEHLFVTSQGSAYGRFRRALDGGNATIALAAAADLQHVGLADALELLLLLLESEPSRFGRLRCAGTAATAASSPTSTSVKPRPSSPASLRYAEVDRSRPPTRSRILCTGATSPEPARS